MFGKRPSRANASRMALGNAVHGPSPRIHSPNVDRTARKGKKLGKSFLSIGNQHKVAGWEAEDVHSLIVDRRQPTVSNELSQSSSAGRQIRPLCRVSRDPWICSQSVCLGQRALRALPSSGGFLRSNVTSARQNQSYPEGLDHRWREVFGSTNSKRTKHDRQVFSGSVSPPRELS
jgi:hypothetical protein